LNKFAYQVFLKENRWVSPYCDLLKRVLCTKKQEKTTKKTKKITGKLISSIGLNFLHYLASI
jgi:hypothetical protein